MSFIVSAYLVQPATSLAVALGIGILVFAVAVWSSGARLTWRRRGSLAGSLFSGAIAAGSCLQDEPWSAGPGYMQEIDRAIGPMDNFLWALAARGGLAILVLVTFLFVLTFWLLGPPRRKV